MKQLIPSRKPARIIYTALPTKFFRTIQRSTPGLCARIRLWNLRVEQLMQPLGIPDHADA